MAGAPLAPSTSQYDIDGDTTPGLRAGASPLLLLHGRSDAQIPANLVPAWATETCKRGQSVQLEWFSTGHRVPYEAPSSAASVVFPWLADRIAGQPPPSSCSMPQP